jgi:hypothetical protein
MRVSSDESLDRPIFTAFCGSGCTLDSGWAGTPSGAEIEQPRHTLRATALDDISG